ncbi:MAG: HD domain-containing phosphohydrolase [Desulfobaccales bacterium]|jgi:putative two-component system response regulator
MRYSVEELSSPNPGMELLYTPSRPDGATPYLDILPSVLVVEDDDQCRRVLLNYLELIRCACKGAANASEALEILAQERIDLVVSDIKVEGMDGVELMQEAHQTYPQVPFIIMTDCAPEYSYHAIINAGASDFIAKPISLGELKAKIWRIQKEKDILRQLQHSLARLKNLIENTVGALASTLEQRNPYTAGRPNRVGDLACAIAREMGLPEERIEVLRLAAFVHDIGKMVIPADNLTNPGGLTAIEMILIKVHCQAFFEILNTVKFPKPLAEMVFQHQKNVNDSGYPLRRKEPMMILEARILAVAEVVEAMRSQRPYRPALELSAALEEISKNRGVLYDGEAVDACLRLCHEKGFTFGSS